MLTDAELDRLECLARAATPGPWAFCCEGDRLPATVWAGHGDVPVCDLGLHVLRGGEQRRADGAYLCALEPETVLRLVAQARLAAALAAALGRAGVAELAAGLRGDVADDALVLVTPSPSPRRDGKGFGIEAAEVRELAAALAGPAGG